MGFFQPVSKRASIGSPFLRLGMPVAFVGVVVGFAAWLALPATVVADCAAAPVDEWVRVKHVYDGDTLTLTDGRKIRLIGINTPERGRDGAPSEPFAEQAREMVRKLLIGKQARVGLRFDAQRRDRYDRVLAHVYTADGRSMQQALLEEGYGAVISVPPNLANHRCYGRAEQRARQRGLGVWALPRYAGLDSAALGRDTAGFHIVRGRVERVNTSKNSVWLTLGGGLALRVDKKNVHHFEALPLSDYQGKRVEVRGWIYRRDGAPRMTIDHPGDIEILG